MPTKTQINDLEILLSLKNETKKAFGALKKDLTDVDQLAELAIGSLKGIGAAGAVALGKLTVDGIALSDELRQMGVLLNLGTEGAGELYSVIRDQNPRASIDSLTDGVRTLQERFSEARVETGELFNFAKDFGLTFNTSIVGANNQLAEFLRFLRQMPDPADRTTTAIAIMGDTGAEQFERILQDSEKLDRAIADLEVGVSGIFDADEAAAVDEYAEATARLDKAWDDLSLTISNEATPKLTLWNRALAATVEGMNSAAQAGAEAFQGSQLQSILDPFGEQDRRRASSNAIDPNIGSPDRVINNIDRLNALTRAREEEDARLRQTRLDEENEKLAKRQAVSAERNAEREAKAEMRRYEKELEEQEKREAKAIEDAYQHTLDLIDAQDRARRIRAEAGLSNDGSPAPFTDSDGFTHAGQGPLPEGTDLLADSADGMASLREESILVADAIGGVALSIGDVATAFNTKGKGALKEMIYLQGIAATASAYTAAAQALSDFSTLSFVDKLAAGATVLATGLGWVAQIKNLSNQLGGSSSSSAGAPSPSAPNIPQAPNTPSAQGSGQTVNVNVQSRAPNSLFTVDDFQDMLDRISDLPGSPTYRLNEQFI